MPRPAPITEVFKVAVDLEEDIEINLPYFPLRSLLDETLKRSTFRDFTHAQVFHALLEDSRAFCVLKSILGMTPPEWADLARSEHSIDIPQNAASTLDRKCTGACTNDARLGFRNREPTRWLKDHPPCSGIDALVRAAIHYISEGRRKR